MLTQNKNNFTGGFTLIEIVLALGILLIGIVSVLSLFPVGLDSAKKGQEFTDSAFLTQYKMADIIYNLDNSINVTSTYGAFSTGSSWLNAIYNWRYNVSAVSGAFSLYRVDILVYSIDSTTTPLSRSTTYVRTKKSLW